MLPVTVLKRSSMAVRVTVDDPNESEYEEVSFPFIPEIARSPANPNATWPLCQVQPAWTPPMVPLTLSTPKESFHPLPVPSPRWPPTNGTHDCASAVWPKPSPKTVATNNIHTIFLISYSLKCAAIIPFPGLSYYQQSITAYIICQIPVAEKQSFLYTLPTCAKRRLFIYIECYG